MNKAYDTVALDEINLMEEPEIVYYSKVNKKTEKLVDHYVSGDNKSSAIRAAYIIRDTVKVLGSKELLPATAGIFYDDMVNPRSGGTGHTMDVCEKMGVPVINQFISFSWLPQ